jgi:GMP synthase PP-ATPase subunit
MGTHSPLVGVDVGVIAFIIASVVFGVGDDWFSEEVSRRIINEVTGISRVAYEISSKLPTTIEWE